MDEGIASVHSTGKAVESTVTINRKEFEDGSSEEIRVEEVTGGFIKTVSKRYKDAKGDWQYSDEKSVSTENPLDNSTLADRLENIIKNM